MTVWHRTRYLAVAGCFPRWVSLIVPAAFVLAMAERFIGGRVDAGLPMLLVVLPVAAGTGLLTRAREGKLDLLLAARCSRTAIWQAAFARAVAVPVLLAVLLAPFTVAAGGAPSAYLSAIARTIAVAGCLAVVGFTLGLVEPRYLAGVLWLAVRVAFATTPVTFGLLSAVPIAANGGPPLAWWKALVVGMAIPELVLDRGLPGWVAGVLAAVALIAAGSSWWWFERADLTGKRRE